jgi:hypothetical protein
MYALILNNIIVQVAEEKFEVHESLSWIDCPNDCIAREWILENGVPTAPPPTPERTYDIKRYANYPPIDNQLDMLYHAIDADSDLKTKFSSFYDAIKAVKDAYPKP